MTSQIQEVYDYIIKNKRLETLIKLQVFEFHFQDDFYQEVILKVLEFKGHSVLIDLYNKKDGSLEKYIMNMASYMLGKTNIDDGIRRGGGSFYIKYILKGSIQNLDNHTNCVYKDSIEDQLDYKLLNEKIDKTLNKRNQRDVDKHYNNLLFNLYRNGMSFSEISNHTGINYRSVRYSIQKTIKLLKSKI